MSAWTPTQRDIASPGLGITRARIAFAAVMVAFATLPVIAALGALYAAWQARRRPSSAPWDAIDVQRIGGPA